MSIGNIELRLPSRIIVDDLNILDQSNEEMLKANRISVSIEILPLFSGQIRITSAQLFGMKAHLTQQNASSPLNCQFLIDSLKSKDTLSNTPLDLRISSLIIRNGAISYDRSDMPRSRSGFSPYHLDITDLSSHIVLNQLTDDSLNLNLKRLHLAEKSGLHVKHLTFGLVAANNDFKLSDFILRLPDSEVNIPLAYFNYATKEGKLSAFNHSIDIESSVALSDVAFLHKNIAGSETYKVNITSKGTEKICNTRFSIVSTGLNGSASATLNNIL
ncbi:MAG: translocation/assembly module TamB, partial [Prevotella sp.]|nr:translocation/assembly module TamB [Prevotella sp.]